MERSQQRFMEDPSECQGWLGLTVDHTGEGRVQERRRLMLCQTNSVCQAVRTRCCHCSVGMSSPPKRVGRESKQPEGASSCALSAGCLALCLFEVFYVDLHELWTMESLRDLHLAFSQTTWGSWWGLSPMGEGQFLAGRHSETRRQWRGFCCVLFCNRCCFPGDRAAGVCVWLPALLIHCWLILSLD